MYFYGLISSDANVEDKTVPLVVYDDDGASYPIGTAKVHVSNGALHISGEVADSRFQRLLTGSEQASIHSHLPKDTIMDFNHFVRKPFMVTATQITEANIHEIAALGIGEVKEKDGVLYIALDRRVIPNIRKAYVGWWVTKLDDNIRCYSQKVFENEFVQYAEEWAGWFDMTEAPAAEVVEPKVVMELKVEENPEPGAFGRLTVDL